jgi:hypothetical protein
MPRQYSSYRRRSRACHSRPRLSPSFSITHRAIPTSCKWGYHVWNAAHGSPIVADDVHRVSIEVQQHLDENFFPVRMDRLTPAERKYLRAMAELGAGPHRSGDIAAQLGVKVESVAPRRSGLIQKGMIYSPAHGDTAFTVPLFDEFLRRAIPSAE